MGMFHPLYFVVPTDHLFHLTKKSRDRTFVGRKVRVQDLFRDDSAEESGTLGYTEYAPPQFPGPKQERYEGFAIQRFNDKKSGPRMDPMHPSVELTAIGEEECALNPLRRIKLFVLSNLI